jgi:hypothetical protein
VGLTGTDGSHVGGVPIQAMFAAVESSLNVTTPPGATVVWKAGFGLAPGEVQHGQSGSTQFSLTSSFASDGEAAKAGTIATAAPSMAATGR